MRTLREYFSIFAAFMARICGKPVPDDPNPFSKIENPVSE